MDRIKDVSCCASSNSKYLEAAVIDETENDEDVEVTTFTTMTKTLALSSEDGTDRVESGISTSKIRIQLSFEVENCVNTRKGFWRKDNFTSPYVVVSAVDSDSYGGGKIGKTET